MGLKGIFVTTCEGCAPSVDEVDAATDAQRKKGHGRSNGRGFSIEVREPQPGKRMPSGVVPAGWLERGIVEQEPDGEEEVFDFEEELEGGKKVKHYKTVPKFKEKKVAVHFCPTCSRGLDDDAPVRALIGKRAGKP